VFPSPLQTTALCLLHVVSRYRPVNTLKQCNCKVCVRVSTEGINFPHTLGVNEMSTYISHFLQVFVQSAAVYVQKACRLLCTVSDADQLTPFVPPWYEHSQGYNGGRTWATCRTVHDERILKNLCGTQSVVAHHEIPRGYWKLLV
jgi:hypothetical protein